MRTHKRGIVGDSPDEIRARRAAARLKREAEEKSSELPGARPSSFVGCCFLVTSHRAETCAPSPFGGRRRSGTFTVDVDDDANVSDLKNAIERVTSVRRFSMQLINLRLRGKPATDDAALSSIEKLPKVVMMMGQKEASYEAARESRGARRD